MTTPSLSAPFSTRPSSSPASLQYSSAAARSAASPAPPHPASALPALPPLPAAASLINLSSLEHYLAAITSRLQQQDALINALQAAVASHVSVAAFSAFSNTLVQHMDRQEARLDKLQHAVDAINGPELSSTLARHGSELASHSTQLREVSDKSASAASVSYVDDRLLAATDALTASIDGVRSMTAPLTAHQRLDSSLHLMASQLSAMQASVAHKIDRAEMPLIENVGHTVSEYGRRMDDMDKRMDGMAQHVDAAQHELAGSVAKVRADGDGRWRELGELVGEKVGMEWLQEHVVDQLRDVQDELTAYAAHDDTMRHIIDQQQQLHDKVHTHHTHVSSFSSEFAGVQERWADIEQRFREKLDVSQYEHDRREEVKRVEQLMHAMSARTSQSAAEHIRDIFVNRAHVQQSDKLSVALKFIDWFTESKLAME